MEAGGSGSRATLETLYIRGGVLDVRIDGDNHVLAGTRAPRYPATSFATRAVLALVNRAASSTETNSRRSALYRSAVCCAFIAASLAGQKPAPRPRYFKPQPQLTRRRARRPRARARQRRKKRRTKHRNKRATSAQLKNDGDRRRAGRAGAAPRARDPGQKRGHGLSTAADHSKRAFAKTRGRGAGAPLLTH